MDRLLVIQKIVQKPELI